MRFIVRQIEDTPGVAVWRAYMSPDGAEGSWRVLSTCPQRGDVQHAAALRNGGPIVWHPDPERAATFTSWAP